MEWFSLFVGSGIYLAGLGFCFWLPLAWFDRVPGLRWSDLGIIFLAGSLLHYLHTLVVGSWGTRPPHFLFFAFAGWLGFGFTLVRWEKIYIQAVQRLRMPWLFFFFLIVAVYFLKILVDPLWEHDARSIWFFSAKILYYAEGFGDASTWVFPDSRIYHFDYPKLVPVLAAHAASLAGYWNEHIPKLSLFVIFAPVVLFLYDLRDRPFSACFFLFAVTGICGSGLWTGIMDGYLAAYAAVGVLFWFHAQETGSLRHLAVSLLAFTVVVSLKAEGKFFVAAFLVALVWFHRKDAAKTIFKAAFPYLFVFIPVLLWGVLKARLQLVAEPDFFGGDVVGRVVSRLLSGEIFNPILSSLLVKPGIIQAWILVALCLWFARRSSPFRRALWLPLVVGGFYGAVLTVVYLMTPLDLFNHLYYSVGRTGLPIVYMLLASVGWWIRTLEIDLRKNSSQV